jgi:hypothetical protein
MLTKKYYDKVSKFMSQFGDKPSSFLDHEASELKGPAETSKKAFNNISKKSKKYLKRDPKTKLFVLISK